LVRYPGGTIIAWRLQRLSDDRSRKLRSRKQAMAEFNDASFSDQASLTVLAEQSPALTVSPRGLPNMDGRELCKLFTPSVRR